MNILMCSSNQQILYLLIARCGNAGEDRAKPEGRDLWDTAGENNYEWAICSWRLSWTRSKDGLNANLRPRLLLTNSGIVPIGEIVVLIVVK